MSTLREAVDDYLALRRGLGFKLRIAGPRLLDFIAFLEREGAPYITNELALRWAMQCSACQPAQWAGRLSFVRGFAQHRSASDPRTQIPPYGLLPYRPERARPYLYTEQEIDRLLQAAKHLPPVTGLRRWTYYCLFGLLSVTGLRISEAIALERQDVDLQQGLLTIRTSKFGKSRLVPLDSSTVQALAQYVQQRDRILGKSTTRHFLVNERADHWRVRTFGAPSIASPARSACEEPMTTTDPACMTFAIASPLRPWFAGIERVKMSSGGCPFCRPTWAMPTSPIRTGIYRPARS